MSFENAKYNTAEHVQDTIQDKLDKKEITKETIKNLQNLKVDILNDESKLNVRDSKGRVIGKLKEGQKISPSGDYKEVNGKLFIGVKYGIRTGFVSADYIRGEIKQGEPVTFSKGESNNNLDITKKNQTPPSKIKPEEKEEIIKEEKNGKEKIETNGKLDTIIDYNKKRSSDSILGNGNKYESGETVTENKKYNEFKDILLAKSQNPKIKMIFAFSQIWIDGARKAIPEQWNLMGLSDDKEIIQNGIDGVNEYLFKIINDKNIKSEKQIDGIIDGIFTKMFNVESNGEDIIDNIEDIKKLFNGLNSENYEERLAKVLELSSGGFRDGNTEKSKEIARNILISKYFQKEKSIIKNINDIDSINIELFKSLGIDESEAEEIVKEIKETYSEVKSETEKHREEIIENFKKQNPDFNGNLEQEINKIISKASSIQAIKLAEIMIVDNKINSIENDSIAETYKDLNDFGQKSFEWVAENSLMIAMSLVPMGAGFAAAGLASKGVSLAMRGKTLANYSKGVQILGNSGKGVAFYEGMNLTNNFLHKENASELLDGSLDTKELIKSALFFNIMGIAQKWYKPGERLLSKPNSIGLLKEVTAFTGIDLGVEGIYNWEMSIDQLANSLITGGLMIIMTRGAGKISQKAVGSEINGEFNINLKNPINKIKKSGKNKENNNTSNLNGVDFIVDSKGNTKINNFKPRKGFSEDIINKNKSLKKEDRINESIKLLGKDLNERQKNAIIKAHNIEDTNLLEKVRILKGANFNKLEREKLLRSGLCGTNKIFNKEEIILIDNKFKKAFNEALEKNNNIKVGNKNIIKRNDGKFEIEGGNGTILKKKELLDSLTTNEKYDLLLSKTIDKVKNLEGVIKLDKKGFFDFHGKYKVSKDEILIKENGKVKKLTKAEEDQFYKDHGLEMIEKVYGVSFKDVSNFSNKYLIDYLKKVKEYEYKGDSKIAKAVHGTFNWTADQITSPHRIIKEITNAKGAKETTKALLFGDKKIDVIGWKSGTSKMGAALGFTIAEQWFDDEGESPSEVAIKYLSFMYMPILWPFMIQMSGIDGIAN